MICPTAQLDAAVTMAADAPGLVVPFSQYRYLSESDSAMVRGGQPPAAFMPTFTMNNGASIGALNVVSADTMRMVGRWDENFAGWGHDDNAMFWAFKHCAGEPRWVEGPAYHLWHPPGMQDPRPEERDATNRNYLRWLEYEKTTDPVALRALTCE